MNEPMMIIHVSWNSETKIVLFSLTFAIHILNHMESFISYQISKILSFRPNIYLYIDFNLFFSRERALSISSSTHTKKNNIPQSMTYEFLKSVDNTV